MQIVTDTVKAVFQLPNLKPVAGLVGTIGEVKVNKYGIEYDEYINNIGLPANFPSSLVVTVRWSSTSLCGPWLTGALLFVQYGA